MEPKIHPLPLPSGWGRGWGTYNVTCEMCGATWQAVAPVGNQGVECPYCQFVDEEQTWEALDSELPNDGCWVTGSIEGDF